MYVPRHWHWSGPVGIVLIGFAVRVQFGLTWDVVLFVMWPLLRISIEYAAYIHEAGVIYQKYITRGGAPEPEPETETITPAIPRLGEGFTLTKRAQMQTSAQTVEAPRFDMERQFAKTLINMHDYKPKDAAVDLREETWKKPNKFGSRDAYVLVRDKWERRGIIGRKSEKKNAPFKVVDWRAVQLIADGNPLPRDA
jgi:hypothetical protein